MSEWEERLEIQSFVVAVSYIDVFAVEDSSAFGAVVKEGRVVLELLREGERQFPGLEVC